LRRTAILIAAAAALLGVGCGSGGDSAEAHYNRALAALAEGKLSDAEAEAGQTAELGGLSDFLRGNVAFARCGIAAAQAETPEAEPFAFDVAIRYAESARDLWQEAAMSREDWPAARRNVERALLKLVELRILREEKKRDPRSERTPRPKPLPSPEPAPPETTPGEAPEPGGEVTELSPEEVLDRLAEKEKEKAELRRSERKKRMAGVERDW
jgi:hypothetical protein